ncbi:MAG: PIN domain-containing protein [Gammaproteobacteria bacterium]
MARIRRERPSPHILIPDTSVLWHEDKSFVVAPDFDAFVESSRAEFSLNLVVPEVVRGELLFQQTTSAWTALERADKQFANASNIADVKYGHRLTSQRLRRDIEKKFNRWCQRFNVEIANTPIESIDWERLISDAIWRGRPFAEDKDTEKGFRDRLILETALGVANAHPRSNVAFLSGDRDLREAANERAETLDKFRVFESTNDFASYLNLTQQELTEKFVSAIQRRARSKFYDFKLKSGLYDDASVHSHIKDKFGGKFTQPFAGDDFATTLLDPAPEKRWTPISPERIFIESTQFSRIENDSDFYWASKVVFVQLFTRREQAMNFLANPNGVQVDRLHKLKFDVHWKARVKSDGRFYSTDVVEIDLADESFDIATAHELSNYRISRDSDE